MRSLNATWTGALILSAAGLLSFLARTFVDYRFVYGVLDPDAEGLGFAILIHLALFGGWIGALVAASHARRAAMYVLLGYHLVLAIFGFYTITTLCPSPCRTGWPAGEISIWSNLVIGGCAAVLTATGVFRKPKFVP